ncbi:hypothetical protein MRX96_052406 [Rhipicephalus microplus]
MTGHWPGTLEIVNACSFLPRQALHVSAHRPTRPPDPAHDPNGRTLRFDPRPLRGLTLEGQRPHHWILPDVGRQILRRFCAPRNYPSEPQPAKLVKLLESATIRRKLR